VDLTPTAVAGVLFGGMTADGSKVFFATKDKLVGTDVDLSTDIYEAEVDGGGSLDLRLISVTAGGPSNSDACTPPGEPASWNAASGTGKCGAVPLAGSAGIARGDGTFYFLSPELLDGPSNGIQDQPNLYVVTPGSSPHFVATVDSSLVKPPPAPPKHPVVSATLVSGLSFPESLAVDESNGDLYVIELGTSSIARYTSAGAPHNFTAGPNAGTNKITGATFNSGSENQLAVDNAPTSPFKGAFYVSNGESEIEIFAASGEQLGALNGFTYECGVAIDQATGDVYVADYYQGLRRFEPNSAVTPVKNTNYTETRIDLAGINACQVGADTSGHIYASNWPSGPLKVFDAADFAAVPPTKEGTEVDVTSSTTVATDPLTDDLYVNTGDEVVLFDSSLNEISKFGSGSLTFSRGLAVNGASKHVYAVSGSNIVEFGVEPQPYEPIDHPAVVHAVADNEIHRYGDFQVTANGDYALFSSKLQLDPAYDNDGFNMIQRYDAGNEELDCASCLPTEGLPTADAAMPDHGLGITEKGEAFFNSLDQLVMRDTNGKLDAYEWKGGEISLISTGFSAFPSSLLTVSSDGRDAFFFTRETLVPSDANGQAMKLYDARKEGGNFVVPSSPPCAASDECHGPGTEAAAPPPIGSFRGVGGQKTPSKCRKGFVKKGGKCKKKARKHRHKKRGHGKRAANAGRGGSR
jgi:hypothetical protein